MDLSNSAPIEDARTLRQNAAHSVEHHRGGPEEATDASEAPVAGGPLASARAEEGETRDAAAGRDTQDRAGDASRKVAETLRELSRELSLPQNHRVSIELDQESQEPLIYVRHVDSGEVVRRIPAEDTGEMLERLNRPTGGLVDRSF